MHWLSRLLDYVAKIADVWWSIDAVVVVVGVIVRKWVTVLVRLYDGGAGGSAHEMVQSSVLHCALTLIVAGELMFP